MSKRELGTLVLVVGALDALVLVVGGVAAALLGAFDREGVATALFIGAAVMIVLSPMAPPDSISRRSPHSSPTHYGTNSFQAAAEAEMAMQHEPGYVSPHLRDRLEIPHPGLFLAVSGVSLLAISAVLVG